MPQETKHATLTWQGGARFDGGEPGGPAILIDGDGKASPSPVVALLMAAAACSGIDIVLIMEKMRVELTELTIAASGVRREEQPRRFLSMHFDFRMAGAGLDETKARRAIDLSIEKYCSVVHSLAPDIAITYDVTIA
jgi:putative redox protein